MSRNKEQYVFYHYRVVPGSHSSDGFEVEIDPDAPPVINDELLAELREKNFPNGFPTARFLNKQAGEKRKKVAERLADAEYRLSGIQEQEIQDNLRELHKRNLEAIDATALYIVSTLILNDVQKSGDPYISAFFSLVTMGLSTNAFYHWLRYLRTSYKVDRLSKQDSYQDSEKLKSEDIDLMFRRMHLSDMKEETKYSTSDLVRLSQLREK